MRGKKIDKNDKRKRKSWGYHHRYVDDNSFSVILPLTLNVVVTFVVRRCQIEGCTKSAVGGFKHCTSHGGGKRCQFPDCAKSAQSSTQYCVRHGGGKKCKVEGCGKVARGKESCCVTHASFFDEAKCIAVERG